MENNMIFKKVPLIKKEMKYKKGVEYYFNEWLKTNKLVLIEEDNYPSFKIIESTWSYKDEYNPEEIYGFSYTLELGGILIDSTEVFSTFWQALENFKQIIEENHKDLLVK